MPRVLVICYYFPPMGLGGVGRPLNLFKRLGHHGWECDILTVKPVAYRAYEPALLDGLDQSRIFRSGSYDPQRLMYLLGMRTVSAAAINKGRVVSDTFFPDSKIKWVGPAVRKGRGILNKQKYRAIISTSPPISSHLVGRILSREFSIPWVADFRDFWTMYRVEESYHSPEFVEKGNFLLNAIREEADVVTGVNQSIVDYLQTGRVITNGFDLERAQLWKSPPTDTGFEIGIPGNFNDEKVIEPLLRVIDGVRKQNPELYEHIGLTQVGQVDPAWLTGLCAKFDMQDRITSHGLQDRARTIDIFSSCHLFYIGLTAEREQGILPQRMFDLAASGRPVLAFVEPQSEIAAMIRTIGNGLCFQEETEAEAVDYVVKQMQGQRDGDIQITPLPSYAGTYSSDAMAERFASLLNELI